MIEQFAPPPPFPPRDEWDVAAYSVDECVEGFRDIVQAIPCRVTITRRHIAGAGSIAGATITVKMTDTTISAGPSSV